MSLGRTTTSENALTWLVVLACWRGGTSRVFYLSDAKSPESEISRVRVGLAAKKTMAPEEESENKFSCCNLNGTILWN